MLLAVGRPAPPDLVILARAGSARHAVAALHAQGCAVRLERRPQPRRTAYAIVAAGPLPLAPPSRTRCCDRALVRGAFLATGAVSRPDSAPHLELATAEAASAGVLVAALERLGVVATTADRRGRTLVLVRSVDGIGTLLSGIGASGGRLRFEEGRVVREVRSVVNRRLNSETANLRRTVDASLRQVRIAAELQRDPVAWSRLAPALRVTALLRCRHPEDSVTRLAARAGTSRSAMAGRLRRLEEAGGPS